MERAADNLDKLELKVAKSVGKEKKIRERRKGWEEVNGGKKEKGKNAFEALNGEDNDGRRKEEREWVSDEEMDDGGRDGEVPVQVTGEVKQLDVVVPESVPLPAAIEEDEFL